MPGKIQNDIDLILYAYTAAYSSRLLDKPQIRIYLNKLNTHKVSSSSFGYSNATLIIHVSAQLCYHILKQHQIIIFQKSPNANRLSLIVCFTYR